MPLEKKLNFLFGSHLIIRYSRSMKSRFNSFIIFFILFASHLKTDFLFSNESIDLIALAEEFFNIELYTESIALFKEAYEKTYSPEEKEKIYTKLAFTTLLNGEFLETLKYLNFLKSNEIKTFLTSLTYRNLNQFDDAEREIKKYLSEVETIPSLLLLESALLNLSKRNFSEARSYLEQIKENEIKSLRFLRESLLIFIFQKEKKFNEASNAIQKIYKDYPEFRHEIFWLEGINAFLLKEFDKSSALLLEALEVKKGDKKSLFFFCDIFVNSINELCQQKSNQELILLLERGIKQLSQLKKLYPKEFLLPLIKLYFLKNKLLNDDNHKPIYNLIEEIEDQKNPHLLGLKIQLEKNFSQREAILSEWKKDEEPIIKGLAYFFSALNYYDKAKNSSESSSKMNAFKKAIEEFKSGSHFSKLIDPFLNHKFEDYFLKCCLDSKEIVLMEECYQFFKNNIQEDKSYELALISCHLFEKSKDPSYFKKAILDLQFNLDEKKTLLLAKLLFLNNNQEEALKELKKIKENWPDSPLIPESLFWVSTLSKDESEIRHYLKEIYEKYPMSSFAPEAYFKMYDIQEYLQGSHKAIKHLELFYKKFPKSPFSLNALFLCGLDNKRDRKTSSNKWIQKRNLIKAVEYFKTVESQYFTLKNTFNESELRNYDLLYFHSLFEKALCFFEIAKESMEAKKTIYLKYSEEALIELINKLKEWAISETLAFESNLTLAEVFVEKKEGDKAKELLLHLIEKISEKGIKNNYFLLKSWNFLGKISFDKGHFLDALNYYSYANENSDGAILSEEEKLTLWIQMSDCHKNLKNYEQAMILLSKAINQNAASSLRIKAMYMRSKLYALQGRHTLARKQLEATAKMGSEWGKQAQEELKEHYGNS